MATKAKKKEESKPKETIYKVPLGSACSKHTSKRAQGAVNELKAFLEKHTKKKVKISTKLNESLWSRGTQKPPRSIKVKAVVDGDKVTADLAE